MPSCGQQRQRSWKKENFGGHKTYLNVILGDPIRQATGSTTIHLWHTMLEWLRFESNFIQSFTLSHDFEIVRYFSRKLRSNDADSENDGSRMNLRQ